jgi:hypothetical protein
MQARDRTSLRPQQLRPHNDWPDVSSPHVRPGPVPLLCYIEGSTVCAELTELAGPSLGHESVWGSSLTICAPISFHIAPTWLSCLRCSLFLTRCLRGLDGSQMSVPQQAHPDEPLLQLATTCAGKRSGARDPGLQHAAHASSSWTAPRPYPTVQGLPPQAKSGRSSSQATVTLLPRSFIRVTRNKELCLGSRHEGFSVAVRCVVRAARSRRTAREGHRSPRP